MAAARFGAPYGPRRVLQPTPWRPRRDGRDNAGWVLVSRSSKLRILQLGHSCAFRLTLFSRRKKGAIIQPTLFGGKFEMRPIHNGLLHDDTTCLQRIIGQRGDQNGYKISQRMLNSILKRTTLPFYLAPSHPRLNMCPSTMASSLFLVRRALRSGAIQNRPEHVREHARSFFKYLITVRR